MSSYSIIFHKNYVDAKYSANINIQQFYAFSPQKIQHLHVSKQMDTKLQVGWKNI